MQVTRRLIEGNVVSSYRTAGGTRPDLLHVRIGNRDMVVKDYRRSDPLFRFIVGPILIRREFGALTNLSGVRGVPELIGKIDHYALAMGHIAGKSGDRIQPGELDQRFYENLLRLVEDMHACGVAHCDLRSRGNVMLGEDGFPYVVDFAACVYRGRGINPLTRFLFSQFCAADRNAVLRLKSRISPGLLTDSEKAELDRPLPFELPARAVGQAFRRLTRILLTRNNSDTTS